MSDLDLFLSEVLRDVIDPPVRLTVAMVDRTTPGLVFNHRTHGTMTVVARSIVDPRYVMARKGEKTPGRAIPIRKSEMRTLAQAGEPMSCLCGSDLFTVTVDLTYRCRDCTRVWEGQ